MWLQSRSAILDIHQQDDKMAVVTDMMAFGEMLFNVDNGYLEGLVRGFRSGILMQSDYLNLIQCETLEGKKNPHFWGKQAHILIEKSVFFDPNAS